MSSLICCLFKPQTETSATPATGVADDPRNHIVQPVGRGHRSDCRSTGGLLSEFCSINGVWNSGRARWIGSGIPAHCAICSGELSDRKMAFLEIRVRWKAKP